MENISQLRSSTSFRVYVIHVDIIMFITIIASIVAIKTLRTKQVFSKSVTHLLISSICYGNLHNLTYFITENWSLYRSFLYAKIDPERSLFNNFECYDIHVLNSCTRILLIFIEIAFNLERILVEFYPQHFSNYQFAVVLNVFTFSSAFFLGYLSHIISPPPHVYTTSCFREVDLVVDLCSTTLKYYTVGALVCLILDTGMIIHTACRKKKKIFDMKSRFNSAVQLNSLIAVSIFSIMQMIFTVLYALAMVVFSSIQSSVDIDIDANLIRWFYTTPYTCFLLPLQIISLIWWIGENRRKKINKVRTTFKSHDEYFQQLRQDWT